MMVLDAWAVLAWLKRQEPGVGHVRLLLRAALRGEQKLLLNIVNLGEVFYSVAKQRNLQHGHRVIKMLRRIVDIVPADNSLVISAATLKARYAISYADAFAAATAILHDVPLVTGDREFKIMAAKECSLKLEWIAD